MNPLGVRVLKFHNITESYFTWTYTYANPTASPQQIRTADEYWMPSPGKNPVAEAIWNSFESARLAKFTWKITNFRVFLDTDTSEQAVGPGPASHTNDIKELPTWVFWYFRQMTNVNGASPTADDEERFQRFVRYNPNTKIWGTLPVPMKQMSWINKSYTAAFDRTTGSLKFQRVYLDTTMVTDYGATASSGTPTPTVWLMPDDPLPKDSYGPVGSVLTRTCKLTVMCDVHTYSTWHMMKQII